MSSFIFLKLLDAVIIGNSNTFTMMIVSKLICFTVHYGNRILPLFESLSTIFNVQPYCSLVIYD